MLVEFAIEIDAIDGSTDSSVINRLLDTWRNYGVLVGPRKRDRSIIAGRVGSLKDATLRKRWEKAWEHVLKQTRNAYRWVPQDIQWNDITTSAELACCGFDIALLKQQRADRLGISKGFPQLHGGVEGARIHDADQTSKVLTSKSLSNKGIEKGIPIKDLWRERFQRFARTSHQVSIVDKFAFRSGSVDGLYQFLKLLDQDSKSSRVIIYTSPDGSRAPADEIDRIQAGLKKETKGFTGSGIETVEIRFLRESAFGRLAHDRHVRFDNNIFDIGRGILIFRPPSTPYETTAHMYALAPVPPSSLGTGNFPPIPKEHLLDKSIENDAMDPATRTITITFRHV